MFHLYVLDKITGATVNVGGQLFFEGTIVVCKDSYMSTVIFAPKTAPKHAPKLLGVLYIYCLKSVS